MSVVNQVARKDVREAGCTSDASKECADEERVDGEVKETTEHDDGGGSQDVSFPRPDQSAYHYINVTTSYGTAAASGTSLPCSRSPP